MIIIQQLNTVPYSFSSGNAKKELSPAIDKVPSPQTNDTCICDFFVCTYVEKIFVDPNFPNDFWKNDKNEFLFRKLVPTDTVDMELHKNGVKVADLIDNTFGIFFDGFPQGSLAQQIYKGYFVDWLSVYNVHGIGVYKIVANLNIIGNATVSESRDFNMVFYSDLLADSTVRIETVQNGNILGSEFDFSGLQWQQSLRIPAVFGNPTPTFETTEYMTSQHLRRQNKATMSREWELSTRLISWEVVSKLVYNKMLGNEILITDYKIKAESIWRRVSVFMKEIDKPEVGNIPNKRYNMKFVDSQDVFTKRNF